jgi:signal peptidase II
MAATDRPATISDRTHVRHVASIALVVMVTDQVVKRAIGALVGPPPLPDTRWLAGEWLGLDYVRNRGVAFGITLGDGALTLAVSLIAFVVAGVVFWRLGVRDRVATLGLGLLAGGAVGNLIDRARFGYVVDFFAVGPWPRFNIADSAITIGMLLLAWSALRHDGAIASSSHETKDTDAQA